jgi:GR25 family glycosyltransferase involved in LPS biosynthesis
MDLGVDKIYVIGLKRFKERRKSILKLAKELNINIEIIEGYDNINYRNDNKFVKKHLGNNFFDPAGILTLGVLCCALSHRKAYKAFLDSGEETALFLEDDVYFTKNIFNYNFNDVRNELKNTDWGFCSYGRYHEGIHTKTQISHNLFKAREHHYQQYSGHAYVLNKKSAEWYYNNTKTIKYAADVRLEFSPFTQLTLDKSVFIQEHMKYYTKSWLHKVHREFFHYTQEDAKWIEKDKVNISDSIKVKSYKHIKKGFRDRIIDGWEFLL